MSQFQQQLQGLPGYDLVMDKFNDYAEDHFNNINPYEDEGRRRKLGPYSTPEEQKLWKKVQKKAWIHDKCFLGSCGVGMDCGLGLAPLVVFLLPGLGPLLMYVVHTRLLTMVEKEMQLPNKLIAEMQGEIVFNMIITFPPIIGSFFSWLYGCSTRNAGHIYKYMEHVGKLRQENKVPTYSGPISNPASHPASHSRSAVPSNGPNGRKYNRHNDRNFAQSEQRTGFV